MARKELKITKVADLKGLKIGNQVGPRSEILSSISSRRALD